MTTLQTAGDALVKVASDYIKGQTGDATWGQLYTTLHLDSKYPLDTYDQPTASFYEVSGPSDSQGVGTAKQWRRPVIRCDVRCGRYQDVRQIVEQVRTALITDFNYVNGNGTTGQGYLRGTGGIKLLQFSEMRSAPLDKREMFRRLLDIIVEVGD